MYECECADFLQTQYHCVYPLALFGCSGRSPINCRCALESFVSGCVEIWKVCNMPSLPLPLPKLSSSMFVPVHIEGVPCWLLDSMKNELVSSERTPPSLVAMPCLNSVPATPLSRQLAKNAESAHRSCHKGGGASRVT